MSIIDKIIAKTSNMMSEKVFSSGYFGDYRDFNYTENETPCYFKGKEIKSITGWRDSKSISTKWKVVTSKMGLDYKSVGISTDSLPCKGIYNLFIIKPGCVCSNTYLVLNVFDSELEANNFLNFILTKFVKFFVSVQANSVNLTKKDFIFVPNMEDYSKLWTDQELYEHFGLSEDEISFINSKIL